MPLTSVLPLPELSQWPVLLSWNDDDISAQCDNAQIGGVPRLTSTDIDSGGDP
jgi:hypothetical protein